MRLRNAVLVALVSNALCCMTAQAEKVVNVLSIDVGNKKQRTYFFGHCQRIFEENSRG